MRWQPPQLVGLRIGGSLLIFLSLLVYVSNAGLLRSLVPLPLSWFGHSRQVPPPLYLVLFRMPGIFIGRSLGVVPPDVVLILRDALDRSDVDDF